LTKEMFILLKNNIFKNALKVKRVFNVLNAVS